MFNKITSLYLCFVLLFSLVSVKYATAESNFNNHGYYCNDSGKTCIESGEKEIDGIKVRPSDVGLEGNCWQWKYTKTCNYPSKNNCGPYSHCYFIKNIRCLLQDCFGNCVNQEQEFSCKSWQRVDLEENIALNRIKNKKGKPRMVCNSKACLDGNCFDKSYEMSDDLFDSVSKLKTISSMKDNGGATAHLFAGRALHCSKKAGDYQNCCAIEPSGWGQNLGAMCLPEEQDLAKKRQKKVCIYVGKTSSNTPKISKHHFCCFNNLLDKAIQVGGRGQLGKNFGTANSPDCRGLTLDEIKQINFEAIDYSEFINELKKEFAGSYKGVDEKNIEADITKSMNNKLQKGERGEDKKENKVSGWNIDTKEEG